MVRTRFIFVLGIIVLGAFACSTGDVSSKMTFYHGQTIPQQFFRIVRYSPQEIEFEIKVDFKGVHMYHLVLNETGNPVSEGWQPTTKIGQTYTVVMRTKKDAVFEEGKRYRLCIGNESPEKVFVTSSNYPCVADYEFVLGRK